MAILFLEFCYIFIPLDIFKENRHNKPSQNPEHAGGRDHPANLQPVPDRGGAGGEISVEIQQQMDRYL